MFAFPLIFVLGLRYVHRVGRTARAGRSGIAISITGDTGEERRMLREIVRKSFHP